MNKKGFTIIESLIAVFVLSVSMVFILSAMLFATTGGARSETSYNVLILSESLLAEARSHVMTADYESIFTSFEPDEDFYKGFEYSVYITDGTNSLSIGDYEPAVSLSLNGFDTMGCVFISVRVRDTNYGVSSELTNLIPSVALSRLAG